MKQINQVLSRASILFLLFTSNALTQEPDNSLTENIDAAAEAGIEYYFKCVSDGCNDSGWQSSPIYTDSGLQPGTTYSYTVTARDAAGNMNNASLPGSATTDSLAEIINTGFENGNTNSWTSNEKGL